MIFWRIHNSQLYSITEVENLGFEKSNALHIPDEYLSEQNFVVCRTCLGIGDWGVISAMPRLLKQKYPDCTVAVPSPLCLSKYFSPDSWHHKHDNPFNNVIEIFKNNPYADINTLAQIVNSL